MRVLVGCEESQVVRNAFAERGHEAYSCDLLDCSGGHPEWHFKENFYKVRFTWRWDRVISFPPCTHLAGSGARWFEEKRKDGRQASAISFFLDVWNYSDVVENPIGIMNKPDYVKKWFPALYDYAEGMRFPWMPSQIIEPWQFGHGEKKATCLWVKGLPLLKPTNIVSGRYQRCWKDFGGCTPGRSVLRSKTYLGVAQAMASQWG